MGDVRGDDSGVTHSHSYFLEPWISIPIHNLHFKASHLWLPSPDSPAHSLFNPCPNNSSTFPKHKTHWSCQLCTVLTPPPLPYSYPAWVPLVFILPMYDLHWFPPTSCPPSVLGGKTLALVRSNSLPIPCLYKYSWKWLEEKKNPNLTIMSLYIHGHQPQVSP